MKSAELQTSINSLFAKEIDKSNEAKDKRSFLSRKLTKAAFILMTFISVGGYPANADIASDDAIRKMELTTAYNDCIEQNANTANNATTKTTTAGGNTINLNAVVSEIAFKKPGIIDEWDTNVDCVKTLDAKCNITSVENCAAVEVIDQDGTASHIVDPNALKRDVLYSATHPTK